ncbi:MAG: sulfatase-like hydrolase/transferase [Planctomycetales bacterium]|nr:sulfatase-like hydrolase/transferase [Planctomycetales bacterium]
MAPSIPATDEVACATGRACNAYRKNPGAGPWTSASRLAVAWSAGLGALLLTACLPSGSDAEEPSRQPSQPSQPNIVLVFIDDMGWQDFSCFGNRDASTPNVDRMAAEGLRFTQFYVNSPICSPSRTAISTGQYPQRWRISSYLAHRQLNNDRGMAQWLDPRAPMLARSLQQAGYATGHFGKWHMGGQRDVDEAPAITAYGFDESLTNFEGMGPKLLPLTLKPGQQEPGKIWGDAERLGEGARWMLRSKITGGFVDAALPFMRKAHAEQRPFYVNLWPDDVHSPFWPPVDKWADGKRGLYLSVLEEMDRQLGKLFDFIRSDESLSRNTLVLICSDNGPEQGAGSADPLRGFKTQLYEGGVRSPLVVWGPGLLSKTGQVDETSVFAAIDLVPTLLDLTKTPHPEGVEYDGESLVGALLGKGGSRSKPIMFRRPPDRDSFYGDSDLPDLAMRSQNWKLLCEYDGSEPELYHLANDPTESTNLANQEPDVVRELTAALLAWHKSMPPDNGATFQPRPRRKK